MSIEEENEQLKEENKQLNKDWEEKKNLAYEIACENERLKKERDILLSQLVINDGEDITVQISQSQFEQYNNFRKALEEIREYLDLPDFYFHGTDTIHNEILAKINEVLKEEEE